MHEPRITSLPIQEFSLWKTMPDDQAALSLDLEITARCNNNCIHCCINLPADDTGAQKRELSTEEILHTVDEAVSMGALWCLVTGGEPLLRDDFSEIYLYLKKKGLLVSLFTNATLITESHVDLFRKYPPRDIEISVYGATEKTYESVTRSPGSHAHFMRGINLLIDGGLKIRFKAMALRSNLHEMVEISRFCREKTKDYYRFDPFLNLRFDGNKERNKEIMAERLLPHEIVILERADQERAGALEKHCREADDETKESRGECHHIFTCGAGMEGFTVSCEGIFRLCPSLWHPECIYDLRRGSLLEAWQTMVPRVRSMTSNNEAFIERCHVCTIKNFCLWCPAHAHLEGGEMDQPVDFFCDMAYERARAFKP